MAFCEGRVLSETRQENSRLRPDSQVQTEMG